MDKLKHARSITILSLVAIICVIFGIMIAAQIRSIPDRITNPIVPYTSLKDTKESLYAEQKQLNNEIKSLQESIQAAQSQSDSTAISRNDLDTLQLAKARAGLTEVSGQGVIVTISDNNVGNISDSSIVHAADLRDIINLLWSSGAEAIAINDQRIVINTAIDCIVNTILINDIRLSTPFTIKAIGNSEILYDRLTNKSILKDIYTRKQKDGLIFDVEPKNSLNLSLFDGSFKFKNSSAN
ncbi:MAG: DUF881 domain-containing protein [bacterium]